MMALMQSPWNLTKEDMEAIVKMPPILSSFYEQAVSAERRYIDEGIRRALQLWVSELEPELMFRAGETRPFGLTAKGHGIPYIELKWDPNFYLDGDCRRYPITYQISPF